MCHPQFVNNAKSRKSASAAALISYAIRAALTSARRGKLFSTAHLPTAPVKEAERRNGACDNESFMESKMGHTHMLDFTVSSSRHTNIILASMKQPTD